MGDKTSLGDRMKRYESAARTVLPGRMPVILRADGKAFHNYTRDCARPWDEKLIAAMNAVAIRLCEEIQGAVLGYVQSDEISILMHCYKRHDSAAWFENQVQKIVSVAASIAGATMTAESVQVFGDTRLAYFDARAFVVPESEVCNYFLWRQQDASRNSVQMLAQSMFSPREMHGKNCAVLQEMVYQKSGQNWNDIPTHLRRGRCVVRRTWQYSDATRSAWVVDNEPPMFNVERAYVEQHLAVVPEPVETSPRFGEER